MAVPPALGTVWLSGDEEKGLGHRVPDAVRKAKAEGAGAQKERPAFLGADAATPPGPTVWSSRPRSGPAEPARPAASRLGMLLDAVHPGCEPQALRYGLIVGESFLIPHACPWTFSPERDRTAVCHESRSYQSARLYYLGARNGLAFESLQQRIQNPFPRELLPLFHGPIFARNAE